MAVRHIFPSDGEYRFSVQNLGIGKFIPGEKLEFLIDNEMVAMRDYKSVGLSANNSSDRDGSIDVSLPVKAGSHHGRRHVPRHELAVRPSISSGNTSANRSKTIPFRSSNTIRRSGF